MNGLPAADPKLPAVIEQPEREVGVLPEGPGEPLVEAARLDQRGETTTSSSRKATQPVRVARQPAFLAAAGPAPPLAITVTGRSAGAAISTL